MALPIVLAVGHKVVVAVAVKKVFFQQKPGNVIHTAKLALPVQLRAVSPCLVAVHEQPIGCIHLP